MDRPGQLMVMVFHDQKPQGLLSAVPEAPAQLRQLMASGQQQPQQQ